MNPIKFECPHCHEINTGDESLYGQRVKCRKCQATILVPSRPIGPEPQTARLIQEPATGLPIVPDAASQETEILNFSPAVRAYSGQILLGVILFGLALGLAVRARSFSWPPWIALVPLAGGVLLLLRVWIRAKSCHYRLTTQRLFVRHGWLARRVDELELYRVKDVVVNQGIWQRLLNYGTITVLTDDDTTPETDLVRISRPTEVKEMIRTQYRAARHREGVQPTEFMRSP